jgi:hypothetical protein
LIRPVSSAVTRFIAVKEKPLVMGADAVPENAAATKTEVFPSLAEIRAVIPQHCFHRSTLRSLAYMLLNIAFVCAAWFAYVVASQSLSGAPVLLQWTVSCLYWFLQGTLMWGIFVLGKFRFFIVSWLGRSAAARTQSCKNQLVLQYMQPPPKPDF